MSHTWGDWDDKNERHLHSPTSHSSGGSAQFSTGHYGRTSPYSHHTSPYRDQRLVNNSPPWHRTTRPYNQDSPSRHRNQRTQESMPVQSSSFTYGSDYHQTQYYPHGRTYRRRQTQHIQETRRQSLDAVSTSSEKSDGGRGHQVRYVGNRRRSLEFEEGSRRRSGGSSHQSPDTRDRSRSMRNGTEVSRGHHHSSRSSSQSSQSSSQGLSRRLSGDRRETRRSSSDAEATSRNDRERSQIARQHPTEDRSRLQARQPQTDDRLSQFYEELSCSEEEGLLSDHSDLSLDSDGNLVDKSSSREQGNRSESSRGDSGRYHHDCCTSERDKGSSLDPKTKTVVRRDGHSGSTQNKENQVLGEGGHLQQVFPKVDKLSPKLKQPESQKNSISPDSETTRGSLHGKQNKGDEQVNLVNLVDDEQNVLVKDKQCLEDTKYTQRQTSPVLSDADQSCSLPNQVQSVEGSTCSPKQQGPTDQEHIEENLVEMVPDQTPSIPDQECTKEDSRETQEEEISTVAFQGPPEVEGTGLVDSKSQFEDHTPEQGCANVDQLGLVVNGNATSDNQNTSLPDRGHTSKDQEKSVNETGSRENQQNDVDGSHDKITDTTRQDQTAQDGTSPEHQTDTNSVHNDIKETTAHPIVVQGTSRPESEPTPATQGQSVENLIYPQVDQPCPKQARQEFLQLQALQERNLQQLRPGPNWTMPYWQEDNDNIGDEIFDWPGAGIPPDNGGQCTMAAGIHNEWQSGGDGFNPAFGDGFGQGGPVNFGQSFGDNFCQPAADNCCQGPQGVAQNCGQGFSECFRPGFQETIGPFRENCNPIFPNNCGQMPTDKTSHGVGNIPNLFDVNLGQPADQFTQQDFGPNNTQCNPIFPNNFGQMPTDMTSHSVGNTSTPFDTNLGQPGGQLTQQGFGPNNTQCNPIFPNNFGQMPTDKTSHVVGNTSKPFDDNLGQPAGQLTQQGFGPNNTQGFGEKQQSLGMEVGEAIGQILLAGLLLPIAQAQSIVPQGGPAADSFGRNRNVGKRGNKMKTVKKIKKECKLKNSSPKARKRVPQTSDATYRELARLHQIVSEGIKTVEGVPFDVLQDANAVTEGIQNLLGNNFDVLQDDSPPTGPFAIPAKNPEGNSGIKREPGKRKKWKRSRKSKNSLLAGLALRGQDETSVTSDVTSVTSSLDPTPYHYFPTVADTKSLAEGSCVLAPTNSTVLSGNEDPSTQGMSCGLSSVTDDSMSGQKLLTRAEDDGKATTTDHSKNTSGEWTPCTEGSIDKEAHLVRDNLGEVSLTDTKPLSSLLPSNVQTQPNSVPVSEPALLESKPEQDSESESNQNIADGPKPKKKRRRKPRKAKYKRKKAQKLQTAMERNIHESPVKQETITETTMPESTANKETNIIDSSKETNVSEAIPGDETNMPLSLTAKESNISETVVDKERNKRESPITKETHVRESSITKETHVRESSITKETHVCEASPNKKPNTGDSLSVQETCRIQTLSLKEIQTANPSRSQIADIREPLVGRGPDSRLSASVMKRNLHEVATVTETHQLAGTSESDRLVPMPLVETDMRQGLPERKIILQDSPRKKNVSTVSRLEAGGDFSAKQVKNCIKNLSLDGLSDTEVGDSGLITNSVPSQGRVIKVGGLASNSGSEMSISDDSVSELSVIVHNNSYRDIREGNAPSIQVTTRMLEENGSQRLVRDLRQPVKTRRLKSSKKSIKNRTKKRGSRKSLFEGELESDSYRLETPNPEKYHIHRSERSLSRKVTKSVEICTSSVQVGHGRQVEHHEIIHGSKFVSFTDTNRSELPQRPHRSLSSSRSEKKWRIYGGDERDQFERSSASCQGSRFSDEFDLETDGAVSWRERRRDMVDRDIRDLPQYHSSYMTEMAPDMVSTHHRHVPGERSYRNYPESDSASFQDSRFSVSNTTYNRRYSARSDSSLPRQHGCKLPEPRYGTSASKSSDYYHYKGYSKNTGVSSSYRVPEDRVSRRRIYMEQRDRAEASSFSETGAQNEIRAYLKRSDLNSSPDNLSQRHETNPCGSHSFRYNSEKSSLSKNAENPGRGKVHRYRKSQTSTVPNSASRRSSVAETFRTSHSPTQSGQDLFVHTHETTESVPLRENRYHTCGKTRRQLVPDISLSESDIENVSDTLLDSESGEENVVSEKTRYLSHDPDNASHSPRHRRLTLHKNKTRHSKAPETGDGINIQNTKTHRKRSKPIKLHPSPKRKRSQTLTTNIEISPTEALPPPSSVNVSKGDRHEERVNLEKDNSVQIVSYSSGFGNGNQNEPDVDGPSRESPIDLDLLPTILTGTFLPDYRPPPTPPDQETEAIEDSPCAEDSGNAVSTEADSVCDVENQIPDSAQGAVPCLSHRDPRLVSKRKNRDKLPSDNDTAYQGNNPLWGIVTPKSSASSVSKKVPRRMILSEKSGVPRTIYRTSTDSRPISEGDRQELEKTDSSKVATLSLESRDKSVKKSQVLDGSEPTVVLPSRNRHALSGKSRTSDKTVKLGAMKVVSNQPIYYDKPYALIKIDIPPIVSNRARRAIWGLDSTVTSAFDAPSTSTEEDMATLRRSRLQLSSVTSDKTVSETDAVRNTSFDKHSTKTNLEIDPRLSKGSAVRTRDLVRADHQNRAEPTVAKLPLSHLNANVELERVDTEHAMPSGLLHDVTPRDSSTPGSIVAEMTKDPSRNLICPQPRANIGNGFTSVNELESAGQPQSSENEALDSNQSRYEDQADYPIHRSETHVRATEEKSRENTNSFDCNLIGNTPLSSVSITDSCSRSESELAVNHVAMESSERTEPECQTSLVQAVGEDITGVCATECDNFSTELEQDIRMCQEWLGVDPKELSSPMSTSESFDDKCKVTENRSGSSSQDEQNHCIEFSHENQECHQPQPVEINDDHFNGTIAQEPVCTSNDASGSELQEANYSSMIDLDEDAPMFEEVAPNTPINNRKKTPVKELTSEIQTTSDDVIQSAITSQGRSDDVDRGLPSQRAQRQATISRDPLEGSGDEEGMVQHTSDNQSSHDDRDNVISRLGRESPASVAMSGDGDMIHRSADKRDRRDDMVMASALDLSLPADTGSPLDGGSDGVMVHRVITPTSSTYDEEGTFTGIPSFSKTYDKDIAMATNTETESINTTNQDVTSIAVQPDREVANSEPSPEPEKRVTQGTGLIETTQVDIMQKDLPGGVTEVVFSNDNSRDPEGAVDDDAVQTDTIAEDDSSEESGEGKPQKETDKEEENGEDKSQEENNNNDEDSAPSYSYLGMDSIIGSQHDVCLSSDSDDDDLEFPAGLLELRKFIQESGSETRSQAEDHDDKDSKIPEGESETGSFVPAEPALKFNLDALLAERKDNEANDRELRAIEDALTMDISQDMSEEQGRQTENDLEPTHQRQIQKLQLQKQFIQEIHRGEHVFDATRYLQVFSYPNLTLSSCGFVPGTSYLDQTLTQLDPDLVVEVLTNEMITFCLNSINCQHEFLNWVFLLMSVHDCSLVVKGCFGILFNAFHRKSGKAAKWKPSLQHIVTVFINYEIANKNSKFRNRFLNYLFNDTKPLYIGARYEDLIPERRFAEITEEDIWLNGRTGRGGDQPVEGHQRLSGFKLENLKYVVQTIAAAFLKRSELYTQNDMMALLVMLFKISLDTRLVKPILIHDFDVCFANIINSFPEVSWPNKVVELCKIVPTLSNDHHNMVHLVQILPGNTRGVYLSRRLGYAMLCKLVFTIPASEEEIRNLKVNSLFDVLSSLNVKEYKDFYLLSSLIGLLDLSLGNEPLKNSEKGDFSNLMELLRAVLGDVRESINVLDRTVVKDKMARLSSKWTFMLQNLGTKQKTLFGWTQKSAPCLPVEELQDSVDSDMEQSEITSIESDSDRPIVSNL